jgi:hypothetical protein
LLPPLGLLTVSLLGMGGLGIGELSLILGCLVCLGIPGTVLGWMALSEIRLSRGQLQGLPLALFAAFCLPALVLDALLAVPVDLVLDSLHVIRNPAGVVLMCGTISTLLSATIAVGVAGAYSRRLRQPGLPAMVKPSRPTWAWPLAAVAIVLVVGLGACLLLVVGFLTLRSESKRTETSPPNLEGVAADQWKPRVQAQFTLPAGQVATFEIVTRSNDLVVPVPSLSAYLIAREGKGVSGTFRWGPAPDDPDGLKHPWQLELVSPDGSHSRGNVDVPQAIAEAPGSISLWKRLEPDREFIEWAGKGDSGWPAIGLRIRTQTHRLNNGLSAAATGTTNWLEATSSK